LSNDVILLFFGNNNLKENSKGGGGNDGGNDGGNEGCCLFWKNGNDPSDKGSEIKNKIIFRIVIYI
jgi:hypothetical protein